MKLKVTKVAKKSSTSKSASKKAPKAPKASKVKSKAVKKVTKKVTKKTAKKTTEKIVKKAAKTKPKSPLTRAELKSFRKLLMDKRRELMGDMSGMEAEAMGVNRHEGSGDLSNIPTHLADAGTDNYEQEFTLGLIESERTLLGEINHALERIEDGIFGVCMGTGKPIGKMRLRAKPWAQYCIDYARKVEQGLIRPGIDDIEED